MFKKLFVIVFLLSLTLFSCEKEEKDPIIVPPEPTELTPVDMVNETFDGTKYDAVSIDDWQNIIIAGTQGYIYNEFNNNSYAYISVYNADEARTSMLISPMMDVENATYKTASFSTRADHMEGAEFTVYTSTDYDGGAELSEYTWTALDAPLSTSGADEYGSWIKSGEIDLSAIGNCVIAFEYIGETGVKDGGFAIDDFKFNQEAETVEVGSGTGTFADPYDIINNKANQDATVAWTKGYIVGFIEDNTFTPGVTEASGTNMAIANNIDETDPAKIVSVQLPAGFIRDDLNLLSNPDMLNTLVWLEGSLEYYYGFDGIKSLSSYSLDGINVVEAPDNGIIGEGTAIPGSELTATTIDFNTYNVLKSEAIWASASGVAKVNAYGKGETESWMISANTIDFGAVSDARLFVTESIEYFTSLDDMKVKVSSDYTGTGDPTIATWTDLDVDGTRSESGESITQFIATGTQYIAFVYTATATNASSWAIKTVEVKTAEVTNPPVEPTEIVNGDFELWTNDTTPEGWTKAESATKESTVVHGGTYSVKHTGGTSDLSQTIAIEGGATYEVNFWYYIESGDGTDGRLWSFFKEGSTSVGDIKDVNDYLAGANGTWHEYKQEYTAPATADHIYFELRTYGSAVVYYDDIVITKK